MRKWLLRVKRPVAVLRERRFENVGKWAENVEMIEIEEMIPGPGDDRRRLSRGARQKKLMSGSLCTNTASIPHLSTLVLEKRSGGRAFHRTRKENLFLTPTSIRPNTNQQSALPQLLENPTTSLTLLTPVKYASNRSNPIPYPPCGLLP